MLISISGTPGTGKTSVSNKLGRLLGCRVIHLTDLAVEKNLFCGYDEGRKSKVVDLDKIKDAVFDIEENNLIIESHFSHEIPADVSIILRVHPRELRKRLENRKWRKKKVEENIEAEIMQICVEEARDVNRRVIIIDTTGKNPSETAAKIAKTLKLKDL